MNKKISVLLATYNSEKYIREQIESLFAQSYNNISITVSDDNSTDSTMEILNEYALKHENFFIIKSSEPLKSAQANFWFLLKNAPEADYYMFCDHDDLWKKEKIEKTLKKMQDIENPQMPALVHSDLSVVDEKLNVISPSMFSMQKLSKIQSLENTLIQNNVTGCTVMINNALRNLATKKQTVENMLMHDWFLAILCLATGTVGFVDEPLILYRQHGNNEVGAKDAGKASYVMKRAIQSKKNKESIKNTFRQADDIVKIYGNQLGENYFVINEYAENLYRNKIKRLCSAFKYRFWKNTLLRKIGQIIFM